jgi:hypothetical protein
MKNTIVLIALCAISVGAIAKDGSHAIRGHTTKNGTYVAPSRATNPDKSMANNYSHKGNVNPATGKSGTKN